MKPKSSPCNGGGTIISFSVGNRLPYSVPLLDLPGKVHQVDVDLRDGDHTIASPEFELGTFKLNGLKTIMGRLRFGYSYDSKNQVITVCGTDYASAADEAAPHQDWNYNTQLMPGVAKIFREIARQANDAFIAALVEAQIYMVRVRSNLSDLQIDDYLNLCVVTSADGQFLGSYDPAAEYEEGVKINPLDSVYNGTTVVPAGTFFANVIGSDGDPKVRGLSWIELWRQMVNGGQQPVACTSYNFNGFACGPVDRGGHIIPGTVARPIPNGSDVYIFPICAAHNNNDNVYMSAITYQTAVWLKNYMGR
ncbi:hypothetical protein Dda_6927 [Drechslerella dactyloides]|uniref:Uncharacterized protein n=1 Tax=Drechslerella dactyloides TaxID=74499 RepID=A0AAD6IUR8_DREDA|nr:hypothetical protein Dda_6927 [Drechslerella dactyloides]